MFELLFKYPFTVFAKGRFVLLGAWPTWVLIVSIVASAAGLAGLIWWRRGQAAPSMRTWRAGVVWALQALLVALVLLLLWEPTLTVAELTSQQNIIAVLVDDSRSMGIDDVGTIGKTTREAAAVKALNDGVLAGLKKRFQTRIYRLDGGLKRVDAAEDLKPAAAATHINDGLKELATETADLPVGAIVLLSDGAENGRGIDPETIGALRNRRIPVHTVGFGREFAERDVEMDDVSMAPRAMAESRMKALVTLHQRGFAGRKTVLRANDGDKVLASKEITLVSDGVMQIETIFFGAGAAGVKQVTYTLEPLAGEQNAANNVMTGLVNVTGEKRRILYVEGEPRWEYKFIRRAAEDDHGVQIVSMLRTTENKIYRQGISDPKELEEGFPARAEDLFAYDGIILGSVEAGYFTPKQLELIREFVDRRGGGLLFLGGRSSLADGGWGVSSVAELLPTTLPTRKNTFHRDPATAQLTPAGAESAVTRLVDDPAKNIERWKKLPYMIDYQEAGTPKPGSTVLAEMNAGRTHSPLLVTESYGRGRTAILATSGTWRWQMSGPVGDTAHDLFWQQLLRWVAADSPGRVEASVPTQQLMDDGRIHLSATVRDKDFNPAPDAHVSAHVVGPQGSSATIELAPVPGDTGAFAADWTADKAGTYVAEVSAAQETASATASVTDAPGRDVVVFQRSDGVAENFHTGQNRDLLEKLSSETGGRYWKPSDLGQLPNEISYSEAGISIRNTKELWDMPIVFLTMLALICTEWMLRRKWGVV
jgi:uncharacterized membrane protein